MSSAIFWFRNDLRLTDNPALAAACAHADRLVLLAVLSPDETKPTAWGFPRCSAHRRTFRDQALQSLEAAIAARGSELRIVEGVPTEVIPAVAREIGAQRVYCEAIAAPEEIAEISALRDADLLVEDRWQSSLVDPVDLPFGIDAMPEVFTAFRQAVESAERRVSAPIQPPKLPAAVPTGRVSSSGWRPQASGPREHASFPFGEPAFHGSESAAVAHLERYFGSDLPQSYKATRNGLMGCEFSTKLSPWLAVGALSARSVYQQLRTHEERFGANESTYWIWFELLWRDFFRFWSLKHGVRLFRACGLGRQPPPGHDPPAFRAWCAGLTGQSLVDAGMRELSATGYLSNRMRQVVASYLVHDLACDWRAGAAWFESCLIDYDVCSNHGNWLYIAGRGADPRQGRHFNPEKQTAIYDRDGAYRNRWRDADAGAPGG